MLVYAYSGAGPNTWSLSFFVLTSFLTGLYIYICIHMLHARWWCIYISSVNGLVIMVSVRYKKLRTPLHYIPVNLVVANLLVTLFGSTVSFSSNINGFFMLGKKLCEFEGFLVSLTGIVGLWSLAILAFERYIMICKPTGDFRFQQKHALMGCAFTWIWSLLWRVPPILGWSSYIPEGLRTSCGPNWYAGGSNNNSYITALFVTCFVLPLSMIRFSYTNLLVAAQQKGSMTTQQAEWKVTQMVIAMVLASLTSWLPYTTFAMVVATNKDIPIQPALASLPSYFSKTATVYNPVIYVFMNKQVSSTTAQANKHPSIETQVSPCHKQSIIKSMLLPFRQQALT
uniref:Pinopsin-like n=1 Tax=Crocodylus porosus TaxID=8502 RepID=A0A7M4F1Z5_CROPO